MPGFVRSVVALLVVLSSLLTWSDKCRASAAQSKAPVFGVLEADPAYLHQDAAAGITLATISLCWSAGEPKRGQIDDHYLRQERVIVEMYEQAGFEVGVDIGLQCPPKWVLELPDGRLRDQYGKRSATANFEFSPAVRRAATLYMRSIVAALGKVTYYRVGLSQNGELLYPDGANNAWWAFDPRAQGRATGLPYGLRPAPMPGWIPGSAHYEGRLVTNDEVLTWYRWYLGAEVNADTWEINTYRAAGFTGELQLVVPGYGALPATYEARLSDRLADLDLDPYHTVNTGAVWFVVLAELARHHPHLVLDISSVGDGSGYPANNLCQATDSSTPITSAKIESWSDTRWLVYLAHRDHLPVIGENPGDTTPRGLAPVVHLAEACGLSALQWAWDVQLREPGYASLADYSAAIRAAPTRP